MTDKELKEKILLELDGYNVILHPSDIGMDVERKNHLANHLLTVFQGYSDRTYKDGYKLGFQDGFAEARAELRAKLKATQKGRDEK